VQNLETLDISDISAAITVEAAGWQDGNPAPRRAVALCRKASAHLMTGTEIGSPAETIDRIAREIHANQIVMSTLGVGSLGNLLIAARVIKLSEVPITLVK